MYVDQSNNSSIVKEHHFKKVNTLTNFYKKTERVNECLISDKTYRLVVAEKSFNITLRVNPPFCVSRGGNEKS